MWNSPLLPRSIRGLAPAAARTAIQLEGVPELESVRFELTVYVPLESTSASPGCAALSACWSEPPGATETVRAMPATAGVAYHEGSLAAIPPFEEPPPVRPVPPPLVVVVPPLVGVVPPLVVVVPPLVVVVPPLVVVVVPPLEGVVTPSAGVV